ncbi:MAG: LysR substrate-binding domain-containing protein [Pseudomonadota bacterium]
MNTRDLEYLVAVAEELHFGKAAERCNASQSGLSGQIRRLEERLGVSVFERTKRHVILTDIGAKIIEHAKTILRSVDDLERFADSNRDPLGGTVTLGMPPTIGPYLTPLLLKATKHFLPGLQIELLEDFTSELEDQLVNGRLDLAVLATPPEDYRLDDIHLYEEPFWFAIPNKHPLAKQETVDVNTIDTRELLLLADGHCLRDQVREVCSLQQSRNSEHESARTLRTSLSTILSLVGAGEGITLVPAMSLSSSWVTDAGISVRRESSGSAQRKVRLTYRRAYHRTDLVEKLADVIAGIVPDTVKPARR